MKTHLKRLLVLVAVLFGAIAPFAGEPVPSPALRPSLDARSIAAEVAREEDHVTAEELAAWIRDRKAGLKIADLRTPEEFETHRLPGAKLLTIESAVTTPWSSDDTVVLVSAGGAHAAQAWVLLRATTHAKVFFLRGGYGEWAKYLAADEEARAYFGSVRTANEEVPGC